jgi:hypothetical protein
MREDGLIEDSDRHSLRGTNFLTSPQRQQGRPLLALRAGHLARDQNRWNQVKIAIGKVGSAPIAVWMKVLNGLIFEELGVASS